MRKISYTMLALAGMSVGCTATGPKTAELAPTSGFGLNKQEPTALAKALGPDHAGAVQQVSFTEKVTTALTTNPFASKSQAPEATEPLVQAAFKDPVEPTPELFVSMAEMADRGGSPEQGRQLYGRALAIQRNHLGALLGLAHLEDREGNLDEALRIYHQAAGAHPNSPTALNDLGLCFARRGDLQTSLRVLDQCVRLEPGKALYRNNVAKVLIEMNMIEPAIAHMAAVNPPAVAQYNVGVLLKERGRTAEAIQHLSIAANMDPQLQQARHLLAEIQGRPQTAAPANGPAQQVAQRGAVPQVARFTPRAQAQPTYQQPGYIQQSPAQQSYPAMANPTAPYPHQQQRPAVAVPGQQSPTPMGQTTVR
ncbi:tetratricopeptide repeat protein [Adhaeretor mobilis]|uniref:tetratricopeptide repeat protein n=1 Tax=Adhaeretor mobilis TaxID=1930276 RepID=UPI001C54DDE5|nr:tetratricopeptide repeat protein [Adhaeretor mobilis]